MKDPDQVAFEDDVRKIKPEADELKILNDHSKKWNYGKDPHKPSSNLGKRKSLIRACSNLIRKHLSPNKWIPQYHPLEFCTLCRGYSCCYNVRDYTLIFNKPLNIKDQIFKRFNYHRLDKEDQSISTENMMKKLIDEKTDNYHLEVIINNQHSFKSYIKRVKQDRLAKSMDIAQVSFVYVLMK